MEYAKIVVKNNYEQKGDLVLRSYIRALRKIHEGKLLDGENASIYGVVDNNGDFHEFFTNKVINYDNYVLVSIDELDDIDMIPNNRKELLKKIMDKVLFNENIELDFEISTIEELAKDRAIEFDAYNNFLSRINPYLRLSESDNQELYNAYDSFAHKIKETKKIKDLSKQAENYDDYDVYDYVERPIVESYEEEYLVFEVPKKLVRK